MSIKDRLSKIEYQIMKALPFVPSEEQKFKMTHAILYSQLTMAATRGEDLTSATLPTTFLGTSVAWDGADPEGNKFTINIGSFTVTQDADDPFINVDTAAASKFIMTVETTTDSEDFILPTGTGIFDYTVDWGDGTVESKNTENAEEVHTYATTGQYDIKIQGTFPHMNNNMSSTSNKIIDVKQWGTIAWGSMQYMFRGSSLTTLSASDVPNLSGVTSMNGTFLQARSFNGDISNWDVSNVTNMDSVFNTAEVFNQDISSWNVSNVTNMNQMFMGAKLFNQDISSWDISNVTSLRYTFYNASVFNQDLNSWDTSNVTNMMRTFSGGSTNNVFNGNISNWNTSKVTNMFGMFERSPFNRDINTKVVNQGTPEEYIAWNTGLVEDMGNMFWNATTFNQDIGGWDTSSVDRFSQMFLGAESFNQDISGWNTSGSTDMSYMFSNASAFNQDIGGWNTGNVTNMNYMLSSTTVFNQDLSGWNVSNIPSEPTNFAINSALIEVNKPIWGTNGGV